MGVKTQGTFDSKVLLSITRIEIMKNNAIMSKIKLKFEHYCTYVCLALFLVQKTIGYIMWLLLSKKILKKQKNTQKNYECFKCKFVCKSVDRDRF